MYQKTGFYVKKPIFCIKKLIYTPKATKNQDSTEYSLPVQV